MTNPVKTATIMHLFRQAVLHTAKRQKGMFQRTSFETLQACMRVVVMRAPVIELLNTCQRDIGTSEQTDTCTVVCPKSLRCLQRSLPSSKTPYRRLQLDGHRTFLKRAHPLPQTTDAVRSSSLIKLVRTQSILRVLPFSSGSVKQGCRISSCPSLSVQGSCSFTRR
jgi:hypothetical protein